MFGIHLMRGKTNKQDILVNCFQEVILYQGWYTSRPLACLQVDNAERKLTEAETLNAYLFVFLCLDSPGLQQNSHKKGKQKEHSVLYLQYIRIYICIGYLSYLTMIQNTLRDSCVGYVTHYFILFEPGGNESEREHH